MSCCLRDHCRLKQRRNFEQIGSGLYHYMSTTARPLATVQTCFLYHKRKLIPSNTFHIVKENDKNKTDPRRWMSVGHMGRRFSTASALRSSGTTHKERSESSSSESSSFQRASSKSILITGGTSGIGFAVAKQAILHGASHVRIVTRDAGRGRATIDRLKQETANTTTCTDLDYVEAETSEYADVKLFHHAEHDITQQKFTTVVHCAGITQTSLLTSTTTDAVQKILSTNLESMALLSKSLLKRYMQTCMTLSRQHKSSSSSQPSPASDEAISTPIITPSWHITSISSLLALKRGTGSSIYAASKAGMIALTRSIALEGAEISRRYPALAPGFRANVVVPGYIETPMTKSISGSSREKLIGDIPTGRFGTPDEVADAVMFLLQNEYANNCVLNLDGGLSAT